jgi:hypothetical protein
MRSHRRKLNLILIEHARNSEVEHNVWLQCSEGDLLQQATFTHRSIIYPKPRGLLSC